MIALDLIIPNRSWKHYTFATNLHFKSLFNYEGIGHVAVNGNRLDNSSWSEISGPGVQYLLARGNN